ncbi:hypothetical protein DENSPDRAFT_407541 [Dentipellis sp. KUC8613]|nr:hypothetical protein DENSPDRAFT_407541 [Dentipellis sp. KUC8613]
MAWYGMHRHLVIACFDCKCKAQLRFKLKLTLCSAFIYIYVSPSLSFFLTPSHRASSFSRLSYASTFIVTVK